MKGKMSQERGRSGRPKLRINRAVGKAHIFHQHGYASLDIPEGRYPSWGNVAPGIQIGRLAISPLQ